VKEREQYHERYEIKGKYGEIKKRSSTWGVNIKAKQIPRTKVYEKTAKRREKEGRGRRNIQAFLTGRKKREEHHVRDDTNNEVKVQDAH